MGTHEPAGGLEVRWIHGSASRRNPTDPPLQVHRFRDDTVIMRQSKDETHEAPFLFLLLGRERALLLDTGAVDGDTLRVTVDSLVGDWLAAHPCDGYQLTVAHTHAHGDHVAGDATFDKRPDTTVVGHSVEEVRSFFGFTSWPEEAVEHDLGGRRLTLIAIPGHHEASVAFYDESTGLLLTGDTVYPGRIYVSDFPALLDSLDRLVDFAARHPVTHVLGCHIEMTRRPGLDYHLGCRFQPDEPPLQMTVDQLGALRDAAYAVAARPGIHRFDDFVICHGMGVRTQAPLLARAALGFARSAVSGFR